MSRLPQNKRNRGKCVSNKNEDLIASFNLREIRLATWHEKGGKCGLPISLLSHVKGCYDGGKFPVR